MFLFWRGGAGPRGFLATLSQYMLTSAATFSFFLAIGSVRAFCVSLTAQRIIMYLSLLPSLPIVFLSFLLFISHRSSEVTIPTSSSHHISKPHKYSYSLCETKPRELRWWDRDGTRKNGGNSKALSCRRTDCSICICMHQCSRYLWVVHWSRRVDLIMTGYSSRFSWSTDIKHGLWDKSQGWWRSACRTHCCRYEEDGEMSDGIHTQLRKRWNLCAILHFSGRCKAPLVNEKPSPVHVRDSKVALVKSPRSKLNVARIVSSIHKKITSEFFLQIRTAPTLASQEDWKSKSYYLLYECDIVTL